jgi:hypothetical protein
MRSYKLNNQLADGLTISYYTASSREMEERPSAPVGLL